MRFWPCMTAWPTFMRHTGSLAHYIVNWKQIAPLSYLLVFLKYAVCFSNSHHQNSFLQTKWNDNVFLGLALTNLGILVLAAVHLCLIFLILIADFLASSFLLILSHLDLDEFFWHRSIFWPRTSLIDTLSFALELSSFWTSNVLIMMELPKWV